MPLALGVRYWEHVVPLALGDVGHGYVDVRMLDTTPDLWCRSDLAGGETSFSRYVRARAEGYDRLVALPLFSCGCSAIGASSCAATARRSTPQTSRGHASA